MFRIFNARYEGLYSPRFFSRGDEPLFNIRIKKGDLHARRHRRSVIATPSPSMIQSTKSFPKILSRGKVETRCTILLVTNKNIVRINILERGLKRFTREKRKAQVRSEGRGERERESTKRRDVSFEDWLEDMG